MQSKKCLAVARPENPIEYTSTDELYRGSRIRKLRREKGLSREKMASLLGCHPDSLSNVEANAVNPSNKLLSKIANVLEAPLEYFTQAPVHPRILRKKGKQPDVYGRRMPELRRRRGGALAAPPIEESSPGSDSVEARTVGQEIDEVLEELSQEERDRQREILVSIARQLVRLEKLHREGSK
jgi:transcriptional regulator with XRE-family HTH domain